MNKKIFIIIISLLLILVLLIGWQYFSLNKKMTAIFQRDSRNAEILLFNQLFVDKVLNAKGEVSYQDRLNIESAIASINDKQISEAWQSFLASANEAEAQKRVLYMLSLFPQKIEY